MLNKIYNEDCNIGIKRIPANTIDLVVIDAPIINNNHNIKIKNDLSKEIMEIQEALLSGAQSYELKHNVEVEKQLMGMKLRIKR